MPDESPLWLFQPSADVMGAMRFPAAPRLSSIDLATATGIALEVSAWLRVFGIHDGESGPRQVLEMVPDLEEIVGRRDATMILLTFDGVDAVRLFVGAPIDAAMLDAEARARALGHSLLCLQPSAIRADLERMADHGTRH
jgi:hypothetical protein